MATRVCSYSKINLGLAIGPVRADGFHALATLYQTLALHDLVTVEARRIAAGEFTDHADDEPSQGADRCAQYGVEDGGDGRWHGWVFPLR